MQFIANLPHRKKLYVDHMDQTPWILTVKGFCYRPVDVSFEDRLPMLKAIEVWMHKFEWNETRGEEKDGRWVAAMKAKLSLMTMLKLRGAGSVNVPVALES